MAHQNPAATKPERIACAPYNFIPLPERVVRAVDSADDLPDHDRFTNKGHENSGYIEVELKTESPLYIRAPLTRAEKRHDEEGRYRDGQNKIKSERPEYQQLAKNKPDFFYIDPTTKQPVVPGSSLRGMISSIFEIITYSKLRALGSRRIIYRDVAGESSLATSYRDKLLGPSQANSHQMRFEYPLPSVRGGYLVLLDDGQWGIQPAKCDSTTCHESFVHVECAPAAPSVVPISVVPVGRKWTDRSNRNLQLNLACCASFVAGHKQPAPYLPTWLVKTRGIGKKHMQCAIYEPDWTVAPIPIVRPLIQLYQDDCSIPRGAQTETRDLLKEYESRATVDTQGREIVPLFYLVDESDELVYFGSTLMFRLPYNRSVEECVSPSINRDAEIDFAGAVFGFAPREGRAGHTQGSKASGYASRVRFTAATLVDGSRDWSMTRDPITPRTLSSPKPTCFQHYLAQEQPDIVEKLVHYDDPNHTPQIRGQKMFWHQKYNWCDPAEAKSAIENESFTPVPKQSTYVHPLRGGKAERDPSADQRLAFRFRVYFHNLSDVELGALLWGIAPDGGPRAGSDQALRYCHKLGMGKPYGMGSVSLTIKSCTQIDRKTRYQSLFAGDGQWRTGERPMSDEEIAAKKQAFERELMTRLELDPEAPLAHVRRISMLLKMMEWPGPTVKPVANRTPADRQSRRRNVRYMTIKIAGAQSSQQNEYKSRPVLPDPSDWMSPAEIEQARLVPQADLNADTTGGTRSTPTSEITEGDPAKSFPRFQPGDTILLAARQEWHEKKGKYRSVYHASDGARAVFEGDSPRDGDKCCGTIKEILMPEMRYKMWSYKRERE